MVKVRQDAWSHEDDLLLAETVLRHIREGSTQLRAFDEVGDKLNRTSAACGFRWNAEIRNRYEQAVAIAKRQRKEKKRAEQRAQSKAVPAMRTEPVAQVPERQGAFPITMDEDTARFEAEIAQETFIVGEHTEFPNHDTEKQPAASEQQQAEELNLSQVITYLQTIEQGYQTSETNQHTIHQLEAENYNLRQENQQLSDECESLKHQLKTMKGDYQVLIQIMDRARKMVIFDDQDAFSPAAFRMDKNGNLEQVAK
ncbi:RsfA family transcriptional regulator [Terribacillus sp. DMT04]|uniref:RsfA family transcriptional regulator n=1 Tax=Terribacillus sp. DMT04 TaxID=2850441 RepID=UPI001C2C059C|nr:RsfA family transcriptional regulator [Terribacillus sp. DMT04]QXE00521.1 RsfA family transcriptional regulator [Terribacillus sp. DMT04]